jgi:hypothetical protein
MRKFLLSILLLLPTLVVFGQDTGLTGKVIDSKTLKSLANVILTIESTNEVRLSNSRGVFKFDKLPSGNQSLIVTYSGYTTQVFQLELTEGELLDLGTVVMDEDAKSEQQLSLVTITDNDLNDDGSGSESTSGLLQASRDSYQQAAAFYWGQARFRIRGLDNEYGQTMINGIKMNKMYDGRPQWSNWGGLNDATRNQEFTMGMAPSDYTFGGILGTQEINTRASHYRTGTRITYSAANTNYNNRAMATHASGFDKNGWAFVVSGSRRWAQEGTFEGTTYNANSLFASVEKKFNDSHSLNFTSIYAKNRRGKNSPNTTEVNNLAGVKYNSYWGWQDGERRNSRIKDLDEPINMLSHYWKINENTKINTNVSYQTGTVGNSRIDFQGVSNPDPTYYRNLPSYFTSFYENNPATALALDPTIYNPGGLGGVNIPNLVGAANANFLTQQQIDWNAMYVTNTIPVTDSNNLEIGRTPSRSRYVLFEDRVDDKTLSANTVLASQLSKNVRLNAGATFRTLTSHNFKNLIDLLGGSYYEDTNTFGNNESQTISDLNNPYRRVGEGDTYGYNYKINANTLDAFTQFKFTYNKIDFYLAQTFARSEYQRDGLYKNGYYPANSFGKSEKIIFENFGFKGGMTYKLSGRHLLDFNSLYMTKAPTIRNTFPNARLNNNVTLGLDSENISSFDASYIIRAPKLKVRFTAFYSKIKNATETSFFFADGVAIDDGNDDTTDPTSNFVAETVTGIDKKNIGLELGFEYQLTSTIKTMINASYGEYTYDNNPNVTLNVDALASATNTYPLANFGESKLKNLRQPGMPQQALSFALEYRDPKFWWVGANANYLAANYIDVAPITRTNNFFRNPTDINGFPYPEITEERARELLKQEKFDDMFLLNITGGKSWRVSKKNRNIVGFFASINNVLDLEYKTGGFEQARNASYRDLNQDSASGSPVFGSKYFYGFGRNYFLNVYYNF